MFLYFLVLVLLSAHDKRFNTSRKWDFWGNFCFKKNVFLLLLFCDFFQINCVTFSLLFISFFTIMFFFWKFSQFFGHLTQVSKTFALNNISSEKTNATCLIFLENCPKLSKLPYAALEHHNPSKFVLTLYWCNLLFFGIIVSYIKTYNCLLTILDLSDSCKSFQ